VIYKDAKYIYPPRPENCFPRVGMNKFDNGVYMAQPKFDGKCTEVYFGENFWRVNNRHNGNLNGFKITKDEITSIFPHPLSNMVVGEYMCTSQKDEFGKPFNNKLMLFDIIVFQNDHLIGSSFLERFDLLYDLCHRKIVDETDYAYRLTDNVYLTKTFFKGFGELWDKFVKIGMLEGLVLKRKDAALEPGTRELNNHLSQIKCRKPDKNYNH
jgi:hypothetical protein